MTKSDKPDIESRSFHDGTCSAFWPFAATCKKHSHLWLVCELQAPQRTHTNKQTSKQASKQTNKQTNEKEKQQTNKQTNTQAVASKQASKQTNKQTNNEPIKNTQDAACACASFSPSRGPRRELGLPALGLFGAAGHRRRGLRELLGAAAAAPGPWNRRRGQPRREGPPPPPSPILGVASKESRKKGKSLSLPQNGWLSLSFTWDL